MKKSRLLIPVLRIRFKLLVKLCTLMLFITFATGTSNFLYGQNIQTRIVSGTVTDLKGETVIGASVIIPGTTTGSVTDLNGKFQISVPVNTKTLLISYIGMKSQEVAIGGLSIVNVKMAEETIGVEEVVVVGYGTQKKVTVTGAVTSVASDELMKTPVSNVSSMLTGRTTGLITVQRTAEPGEDVTTLRIRGNGTFSGSNDPLIMVDGIETTNLNSIDPNEIENVAVLKDASATAVYGVRGANGVVIVTTKRGNSGKPKISFSTNFAANTFNKLQDAMGAYDYASGYELAKQYDSYISGVYVPQFTATDLQLYKDQTDPIFHPDTDWHDLIFKDYSLQYQHNLNIRGGTEKVKYFISAGVFHQGGLFNNTDLHTDFFDIQTEFDRYNFRSNFDFDVTKKLKLLVNISNQLEEKSGVGGDDTAGLYRNLWEANPISHPAPIDGKVIVVQKPILGVTNSIETFYKGGYMKRYRNYLNSSIRLNYDLDIITKGLSAHGTISYQNFNEHKLSFDKNFVTYSPLRQASGEILIVPNGDDSPYTSSQSTDKDRRTYLEFGLDYNRSFGDHNLSALLLYNQSKFFNPDLQYKIPQGYQGTAGRIAYDYKRRYLTEFNMGHNGTENFAPGKRFGFFPAFSLGWVPSEEPFFPKNNLITFLKFRGSYGEVGNDKIGGNRFLYTPSAYNYKGSYWFGQVGLSSYNLGGAYEGKVGNPDITWERAKKTDVGVEMSLLKGHVKFTADYFKEKRDNILTTRNTVAIISGIGDNFPTTNIGIMENKGYDGELSIHLKSGALSYWFDINYTYAHNTVIYRDEIPNPYTYQYATGQRQGQIFGPVEVDGLYNSWMEVNEAYRPKDTYQNNRLQPGDIHWKDINGDGKFDNYDSGPIGYSNFPEKTLGISFGASYKGFDFSALIQGNYNVSFTAQSQYMEGWRNSYSQTSANLLTSWSQERYEEGLPIYFPHYNIQAGTSKVDGLMGTYFVDDQSYIRIRNTEIGYTIDKNSIFAKAGISSARIYLNGANLFTYARGLNKRFKGVDPEILTSFNDFPYPKTITFNVGANINF